MKITGKPQKLGGWAIAVVLLLTPIPSQAEPNAVNDTTVAALEAVINGEHRSGDHKARDKYRHPLETLTWLGIKENMTVVEISPGRGWYMEILAPFYKDQGMYYAVGPDAESEIPYRRKGAQRLRDKLAANPELYSKAIVTELAPPKKVDIAPEGSADMVLTFRNVHNWMSGGYAEEVFRAMYRALKPGGILGLVEHRGNPAVEQDPKARSGYVTEEHTIQLAKAAGFQLVDRSEINANPKDTKDYSGGVWTLPPALRLKEVDQDKYLAIGESDRMTLKFIKPAAE